MQCSSFNNFKPVNNAASLRLPPERSTGTWPSAIKVRRVEMVFGEPMYFTGDSTDQAVLRTATNQIMEKIAELSKQEYVSNMYASEAKDAIKKSYVEEDQIESDEE